MHHYDSQSIRRPQPVLGVAAPLRPAPLILSTTPPSVLLSSSVYLLDSSHPAHMRSRAGCREYAQRSGQVELRQLFVRNVAPGYQKRSSSLIAPTNGKLHAKASMKFGDQYGCELELYCLMVMFCWRTSAPRPGCGACPDSLMRRIL
jgi:hypothetical protein